MICVSQAAFNFYPECPSPLPYDSPLAGTPRMVDDVIPLNSDLRVGVKALSNNLVKLQDIVLGATQDNVLVNKRTNH